MEAVHQPGMFVQCGKCVHSPKLLSLFYPNLHLPFTVTSHSPFTPFSQHLTLPLTSLSPSLPTYLAHSPLTSYPHLPPPYHPLTSSPPTSPPHYRPPLSRQVDSTTMLSRGGCPVVEALALLHGTATVSPIYSQGTTSSTSTSQASRAPQSL